MYILFNLRISVGIGFLRTYPTTQTLNINTKRILGRKGDLKITVNEKLYLDPERRPTELSLQMHVFLANVSTNRHAHGTFPNGALNPLTH